MNKIFNRTINSINGGLPSVSYLTLLLTIFLITKWICLSIDVACMTRTRLFWKGRSIVLGMLLHYHLGACDADLIILCSSSFLCCVVIASNANVTVGALHNRWRWRSFSTHRWSWPTIIMLILFSCRWPGQFGWTLVAQRIICTNLSCLWLFLRGNCMCLHYWSVGLRFYVLCWMTVRCMFLCRRFFYWRKHRLVIKILICRMCKISPWRLRWSSLVLIAISTI